MRGQVIAGRYRLENRVGSGGNGVVWQATDTELERVVAVKRALTRDDARRAERIRLLRREARILAKLNHPNIVTLFDVVADGDDWWLVMEFFPARSLADQGVLPPDQVAGMGAQLAGALEAVHANGILHRDIKPGNVLVTEDGRVKLSDFGLSRVVAGEATLADTGLLAGTPGYVAPEVARGEDPVAASDVFSLGATLFAATEGICPFGEASGALALIRRAAAGGLVAPRQSGPLAPVLSELLHVDPAHRPTAARARTLLAAVAGGQSTPPPESVPISVAKPWRKSSVRVGVAGVLVVVAVLIAWLALRPSGQPAPAAAHGPAVVIGDQHAPDPCALAQPAALGRFGQPDLQTDDGNFNRCDVMVTSGASQVDVKVELQTDAQAGGVPQGRVTTAGALRVVWEPEGDGECDRAVVLADRNQIDITAQQDGNGTADLCAIADVATNSALAVVSHGAIPVRTVPVPDWSFFHANACALPDADALAKFPGVDALHPVVGFGDWECRWYSTTSQASLLVRFDRNEPLTASDGQPVTLAGRSAFVQPNGYGDKTCEVSLVGRQYTDQAAQATVELLLVVITGPQPPDQLCGQATDIARAIAPRLPT